jgi:transcription termination factor Rho
MKKQILVFTSFLLITVLFIPTFSQNSKIDIKQYAKAAEEVARLKPENEKKIAGIILERINKMVSENAQTRINSEEIVRLYSSELLKVDKAGRVYVNVSFVILSFFPDDFVY